MALTLDTFTIKRGDTLPAFTRVLKFSDGTVQDLTDATSVIFIYRPVDGDGPDLSATAVSRTCTINAPATDGSVTWAPIAADTATVGRFYAEFEVTFSSGDVLTFPNSKDTYILYCVVQDVAP